MEEEKVVLENDELHKEISFGDQRSTKLPKKKGRHGARNQHRHKHVVKWIVQKFPDAIELAKDAEAFSPSSAQDGGNSASSDIEKKHSLATSSQMHILDVAGGKGELAARLTLCHRLHVKMVDPRPADILDCFNKNIFRSLPKKWQQKISSQDPNVLKSAIQKRFHQHVMYFPSDADGSTSLSELEKNEDLLEAVTSATLLIGMHSDGATEAIVDVAMRYRKPFMVVPCCVFPNFFKHRLIPRDIPQSKEGVDTCEKVENELIPVRSHEQFCRYLLLKDSHFIMETLPFEGRNVAICWDGCHLDSDK
jgi:hypothetical protein